MKIKFVFLTLFPFSVFAGQALAAKVDEDLYFELNRYDGVYLESIFGEGDQMTGRIDTFVSGASSIVCNDDYDDKITKACWIRNGGPERLRLTGAHPSNLRSALINWAKEKNGQKLDSGRGIVARLITCKNYVTYLDETGYHHKQRFECSVGGVVNQ